MYKKTAVLGTLHQKAVTYLDDKKSRESYINYRKQFQNAATFKKIYPYPIHVDIEIDNFCNFACTFCPIGQPSNRLHNFYKTRYSLENNTIFKLLDECKEIGVKSVQFNLVNEPLANKNLFTILNYAKKLKFDDIYFITNGYLVNKKNSLKILQSGLTKIKFSLDAFSSETYVERKLKNYKPASYKKVLNNILDFLDMKNKKNKKFPLVTVNFISMESNKHEIKKFKKFWESKVDEVHIQKFIDYMENNKVPNNVETRCNMPLFRLAIKSDGNVKPCCIDYGTDINLGNIYEESLLSIWNSKFMKNFQQMHVESRSSENESCKKCLKNRIIKKDFDIKEPQPQK